MLKRKRTYNLRLVKETWPYTVQEIAALFKLHKNAVLRWLDEGLQADRNRRPFLIRGSELIRFLASRQKQRKRKCAWGEFFCFRCRAPREAYLRIADLVIESSTRFRVKVLCATCSTPMNKMQGIRNLQRFRDGFHVQQLERRHLIECDEPSVKSDMEAQK